MDSKTINNAALALRQLSKSTLANKALYSG